MENEDTNWTKQTTQETYKYCSRIYSIIHNNNIQCYNSLHRGVCKKLRDLLDAILVLGNTLMIQKNTTRSCYVILGLVKLQPDMSYDT